MSNDNTNSPSGDRRGSVTSAALCNLWQRSNSTSTGNGIGRESVTSVASRDQRRRLSVNTIGLSGTSPNSGNATFGMRRGSNSTNNSDAVDESAIEDEESAKIGPTSPFARRISFGAQAMLSLRTGSGSPGSTGRTPQQSRRISNANTRALPSSASSASTAARRASTSQTMDTTGPSSLDPVPKAVFKVIDRPLDLVDTARHLTAAVNMIALNPFPKCHLLPNKLLP